MEQLVATAVEHFSVLIKKTFLGHLKSFPRQINEEFFLIEGRGISHTNKGINGYVRDK